MVSKEQKLKILNTAIGLAKEFGRGGTTKPAENIIDSSYKGILKIMEEIDQEEV